MRMRCLKEVYIAIALTNLYIEKIVVDLIGIRVILISRRTAIILKLTFDLEFIAFCETRWIIGIRERTRNIIRRM